MRQVIFSNEFVRGYQGLPESPRRKAGRQTREELGYVVAYFVLKKAT
jgi:hypothetical protein